MKKIIKRSLYTSLVVLSFAGAVSSIQQGVVSAKKASTHITKKHKKSKKHNKKAKGQTFKVSMTSAEKDLANKKYEAVMAAAKKNGKTAKIIIKSDKSIDPAMPFNKKNYQSEYIYTLNHPSLIRGGQGAAGGQLTGVTDGLTDFVQYQSSLAVKQYAQDNKLDQNWLNTNSNYNDKKTFAYWYVDGFHDNLGGDNYNGSKKNGGQAGLDGYKAGLKLARDVKDSPASDDLIQFTQNNLNTTVLAQKFFN